MINLCEMKYSHGAYDLTPAECEKLLHRRDVFIAVTGTRKSVHLTMVTSFGVKPNAYAGSIQSFVTLDDLYQ